ncbi:MAG: TIGR03936 family radical SAM-associated protein [Clostridiales Family XIII bacterium]|jgi:radical SAM-linked protein|nr:TIGR03936 family radical SAM-associated protein [Clostridiales Family XIII bacterium]
MRYLIRFEKKDRMIYISHLDVQRVFHRAVKRLSIDLKYSKGFNPHPKLSFAQPLSLGHSSTSEYLEFETEKDTTPPALLKERFNTILPRGIRIIDAWTLPYPGKSVSSLVAAAKYLIEIPFFYTYRETTMEFFGRERIMAEKSKKNSEPINIRPMIISLKPLMANDNTIALTSTLHCGSNSNLNPELMLRCFYECGGKAYDRDVVKFERVAMLGWSGDELTPLEYLCGAHTERRT